MATRIVTVVVDFDSNGVSTGSCSVDGKRYSNFPAGLVTGQKGIGTGPHSLTFQAETSDFGTPATLSAYTLFDHRKYGASVRVAVSSHN